jgi:hypothetical protein
MVELCYKLGSLEKLKIELGSNDVGGEARHNRSQPICEPIASTKNKKRAGVRYVEV